jgi:hemerythrin-like domain-containing protein
MAQIDSFKKHHLQLQEHAQELSALLKADQLAKDGGPARRLLSKLAGLINVHLAMEDKTLYPRLIESADAKVKEVAVRFSNEMGGIKAAFEGYNKKWPLSGNIQADPAGFVRETTDILKALAQRISKEDRELYPLAEKI